MLVYEKSESGNQVWFLERLSYWLSINAEVKHSINARYDISSYIFLISGIYILLSKIKQIMDVNVVHPLNGANKLKVAI